MALGAYDKVKHSIRYWFLRRLPACKETVRIMSESMERRLTVRERINVKLHLWVCLWCVWYLEQLQLMRNTIRSKAAQEPNLDSPSLPSLSPEARERMKLDLSEHPN